MKLWRRHLNQRVRLHLSDGPTIEGRLVAARAGGLRLVDALVVVSSSQKEELEGTVIIDRARLIFGQVIGNWMEA